jgi:hypothetical protein
VSIGLCNHVEYLYPLDVYWPSADFDVADLPQGISTTVFTTGICINGRLGYHNAICIVVNAI